MTTQKNSLLIATADALAQEEKALAIICFIPIAHGTITKTPIINVMDVHPEILQDNSMMALLDYCNNHIIDAVIQYRVMTEIDSGKVVAVFPNALLIYDIESTKDELNVESYASIADPNVIYTVLSLALEIAHDGREGRSIGTAFIIGDIDELKRWSHQGVLNPYEGHPKDVRDITKKENWESVKEFAQLDGVFLINEKGIIEASGRYLDADGRDVTLQSGLGGRHLAAAAITKVTPSIGIVVSESGGIIRVFVKGEVVAHIRTDIRLMF